jgi:hypothetical protein
MEALSLGNAFRLASSGVHVLNVMAREEKERKEREKQAEEDAKMRARMAEASAIVKQPQKTPEPSFGFGKRSRYE